MDEYIKREDLLELYRIDDPVLNENGHVPLPVIRQNIIDIPSADVAPVVRCKHCKHRGWVQEPCHGKSVDFCRVWDSCINNIEKSFCSYGERKEGAD